MCKLNVTTLNIRVGNGALNKDSQYTLDAPGSGPILSCHEALTTRMTFFKLPPNQGGYYDAFSLTDTRLVRAISLRPQVQAIEIFRLRECSKTAFVRTIFRCR
jgi:hypothetical protein